MTAPTLDPLAELEALGGMEPAAAEFPREPDPFADAPAGASAPTEPPTPAAVPGLDAPPRPRKRRRAPGELGAAPGVTPDLVELYRPDTVGRAWCGLLDSLYRLCGAAELTADERKNNEAAFAHYLQARAPKSLGRFEPEFVLFMAVAATVPPRIEPVAKASVPFWKKLGGLFRRKPKEEGADDA